VEPTYYTEVAPETFFDTQTKVYQRFADPFTTWANTVNYAPLWAIFYEASTESTDEMIMPNRNGDWYDDGYYLNSYWHRFAAADYGSWYYTWTSAMKGVSSVYSAIEDMDHFVDFEALGFPEGTRESMVNQLNVLVAYYYLGLLDHFGGVPLYISNQDPIKGRSTDKETFDFLEKLLLEAIPALPEKVAGDPEKGYVTQATAAAMLAKLYLNAEAYTAATTKENRIDDCKKVCEDLLDGKYGNYQLASRFQDVFGFNNARNPELIWVLPAEPGKFTPDGSCLPWSSHYNTWEYLDNEQFMSWNGYCLSPSQGFKNVTPNLNEIIHYRNEGGALGGPFKLGCPYDKFEDSDLRKKNYLYLGGGEYEGMFLAGECVNRLTGGAITADGSRDYPKGTIVPMTDYIGQLTEHYDEDGNLLPRLEGGMYAEENSGVRLVKMTPTPNGADNDLTGTSALPVIRFAEVYYMLAECKYRKGDKAGAAELINQVRRRYFAGGADPNPVTAGNLNDYRFLDELLIEFIGEGHRRTDLIRFGKYVTENWWDHKATNDPNKNRFPVPVDIINANPLIEQNPGY
jgi:hypothetical protein